MVVTNVRSKVIRAMNVSFMPGTNIVPEVVSELLKKNGGFNKLVADGTLAVKEQAADVNSATESGKLPAPEMIAVVNGMCDIEALSKLEETETRKSVLKAIEERFSELTDGVGDSDNGGE